MDALLIVLPTSGRLAELLSAIKEAGAPGATVYDSQGLEFLSWLGAHPAMGRYFGVEGADRETGKTILSIVPESATDRVVAAVERVLDGFSAPFSGMLCSWKIANFRCFDGDKTTAAMGARS